MNGIVKAPWGTMFRWSGRTLGALIVLGLLGGAAFGQPRPGDVFRVYRWTNEQGDAGGSLRVGGKKGAHDPGRGSDTNYVNDPVTLSQPFDLDNAVRAEVVIEKLLCHDGTHGLAISVNGHEWLPVPEAPGIPAPQWEYQHHIYPVVQVSLAQLKAGAGNQFRLRVSPEHPWNWPQHLIYGVHFRVYYDAAKKPHPVGRITSLKPGQAIGLNVPLEVSVGDTGVADADDIQRVEFIGNYEDVNYEGDGRYTQWHSIYQRGALMHHLGSAPQAPWRINWDTTWVPDQPRPLSIAARITDTRGVIAFTEAVEGLRLERPGFAVELCKPFDVSRQWVTRKKAKGEKFKVTGDLATAAAAQLVFTSWSPGYMNGILINGKKVFEREGERYCYGFHRIPITDLSVFKSGENTLETGLTPRDAKGNMVHGMEVHWPGIMVLIQYDTDAAGGAGGKAGTGGVKLTENTVDESAGNLPCYKIETPAAHYCLEKSGAGLSSMIDRDGHDWLGFHPEPGSGAAGEYRGFPNAVHQQGGKGAFHPMNEGAGKAITKVEAAGPNKVTIAVASEDGQWAGRYDFFPTHCTFTMTKMPEGAKYWALYEGTPGGACDAADWWITSDQSHKAPLTQPHEGDIPAPEWIAFGDAKCGRTLFMAHHEDDPYTDRFYQMNRQMTVFGFGREGLNKFIEKVPQSFSIGFVESADHGQIGAAVARLMGLEEKPATSAP